MASLKTVGYWDKSPRAAEAEMMDVLYLVLVKAKVREVINDPKIRKHFDMVNLYVIFFLAE